MKFTTTRGDLISALKIVAPAISNGSPLCLLEAHGDAATLAANGRDLGIRVAFCADIQTRGAIALPHRLLTGLVSRFEDGDAISLSNGTLASCGAFYDLPASDPEDFMELPAIDGPAASLELQHGVKACLSATSSDISKQILQGVHIANGFIESTDGHRMVRFPVALPDGLDVVLPASTMRLLEGQNAKIAVANNQAIIHIDQDITIYSRVLDGRYPNIGAVMPSEFSHSINLNRHGFTRALERVALIAEAHNSVVKLCAAAGAIAITAEADSSNGKELLTYDGKASGTWGFNVGYLLDGLKAFRHCTEVTFAANGPTDPVLLTGAEEADGKYLIMPIQLL
jgi:DNA polymerase-3 subunit beta